jgi:hypothetical protein
MLMLFVQLRQRDIVTSHDSPRKLLHVYIVVAPIVGVEDDPAVEELC